MQPNAVIKFELSTGWTAEQNWLGLPSGQPHGVGKAMPWYCTHAMFW
jgi:hypothetical protein